MTVRISLYHPPLSYLTLLPSNESHLKACFLGWNRKTVDAFTLNINQVKTAIHVSERKLLELLFLCHGQNVIAQCFLRKLSPKPHSSSMLLKKA